MPFRKRCAKIRNISVCTTYLKNLEKYSIFAENNLENRIIFYEREFGQD